MYPLSINPRYGLTFTTVQNHFSLFFGGKGFMTARVYYPSDARAADFVRTCWGRVMSTRETTRDLDPDGIPGNGDECAASSRGVPSWRR